jgi:ABC-type branched-subunit amino acid transport system ATPase component
VLEVRALHAWYGDSHILHDIGLQVQAGRRVSILGRNGAGKSTLLKSILNGGPRVEGLVGWNGKPLGGMASFQRARLGLALVPEDRRIFTHLSVVENIEMARYATSPQRPPTPTADILARFPMLQSLTARLGGQMSGGQQQMLAVARAVAARPHLMLLDEPTEGLAPVIVEQLAEAVKSVCEADNVGLLLSEQNVWFARKCTDYVYVLGTGRIVFAGDWASFDRDSEKVHRHLAL